MASLGSPTLDCFRNGSVIQLKSKLTDKTLTPHQSGSLDGNGPVGFYAGCLAPRAPIWGRWTDGTYHRGTITNVDTRVHIKFNDGDIISHHVHDQTAVVADVNPHHEVLQIGSRVIAQYRSSAKYYPGRVMNVDRADRTFPSCYVVFDDGDRGWANLNQLRVLPEITSSVQGTPPVLNNSRVLARWTNNLYYHGRVTSVGGKINVQFDDGDRIQHDYTDISAVISDVNPSVGTIQVLTRVIGYWPKTERYYLGRVTQINYVNPQSPRYFVQFDDGDRTWCNLNEIRPVPQSREQVGCVIWGRWTNGLYYHGRVTDTGGGKIHVQFDDGDKISHDQIDDSAVLIDEVPNPDHVRVGSRVIAGFKDRKHYFKGRVTNVNRSNFYTPRYYIHYDDGDKGWESFDRVRLLPMRVDEVGTRVYGRWTNGLYYSGKVERLGFKTHILFDDGDRITHDRSDVTAVILDISPDPGEVRKGSRVIAFWPKNNKYYPASVADVDKRQDRYYIYYDDGDKGWANVDQVRLIPAPGPAVTAQFTVISIGGNVVALNSVAYPQFFLGIENGKLKGKTFDNYCHFYVHETPDQYVYLESCMFPGQHVGVNRDGSMIPPPSVHRNDQAFFEVKLLFSPYGQIYKADHTYHGDQYPAQPGGYPRGAYPGGPQYPGYNPYPGNYPGYGPPPPY